MGELWDFMAQEAFPFLGRRSAAVLHKGGIGYGLKGVDGCALGGGQGRPSVGILTGLQGSVVRNSRDIPFRRWRFFLFDIMSSFMFWILLVYKS